MVGPADLLGDTQHRATLKIIASNRHAKLLARCTDRSDIVLPVFLSDVSYKTADSVFAFVGWFWVVSCVDAARENLRHTIGPIPKLHVRGTADGLLIVTLKKVSRRV